jgi:hypothetical protein
MSTPDFDQAILRQAFCQTLSHVLDVTLDDQNVNHLLRNHPPPYFAHRNTGAPPLQLGYSHPSSHSMMLGSLNQPFTGKISDSFFLATVEAERRRMGEIQATLLGKQQMLTHQAQKRHALLTQQKQQDAYALSFLQSMVPMQSMRPSPPPPPPTAVLTTSAELWQAHGPTAVAVTDPSNVLADPTKVLKVLGGNLRGKSDPYIDVSRLAFTKEQQPQTIRGGVTDPFPQKLYRMLQDVEEQGKTHIVSFLPHGRALAIHDMEAFTVEILPKYFAKQSKLVSFVRQLNLYGFVRIHSGPDLGGYYHELFLKGRPELSAFMRRTGANIGSEDRRKRKDRHVPAIQPNFYAMQPIRPSQEH